MSAQFNQHPFLLTSADVAAALDTDIENGLNSAQVAQLQHQYPSNELDVEGSIPWNSILAKQLFNAMILGKCENTLCAVPSYLKTELIIIMYSPGIRNDRLLRH